MGKFDGVLLASDFDNTLIYTEPAMRRGEPIPPLPENNRKALEYFMAEGGRFAVATGRALPAFRLFQDLVPMNAPGIVCNGAALYDFQTETYVETALLDKTAGKKVQQALDLFPELGAEAYHIDNMIYAVHPNAVTRSHERITKVGTTVAESFDEVPEGLGKVLWEAEDHADLEKARAYAVEQGWDRDYEMVFSNPQLMEMTVKGASKGSMLLRLAAWLGISPEHVYAAGDESNDISMLTAAARGFAPENCSANVRACGAEIVCHAEQGAIADIIARLDARYPG